MPGYSTAIESVYSLIEGTDRTVFDEIPFTTSSEPDQGYVLPVDELVDETVDRVFSIRLATPPVDDGSSGYVYSRFSVGLELMVRYSAEPRTQSETMICEDVAVLVNRLVHPSGWGPPIETIVPPGPPTLSEIVNDSGVVTGLLLVIPFEMIYIST